MFKRGLLRTTGIAAYVGLPLIPVIRYWGFLTTTDAKTTVSSAVLLCLIACFPVVKQLVKTEKLFNVNVIWVCVCVLGLLGMYIGEQMAFVGAFGIAGSVSGTALMKVADKMKETSKQSSASEQTANLVTAAVKAATETAQIKEG